MKHTNDQRFAEGKLLLVAHPQGFRRGKLPAEGAVEAGAARPHRVARRCR